MNIKQAKIKLEKINALFRNISMDEPNITDIEKDLMRSYIQQFYEAFLNIEKSESKGSETFKPVEKEVKKVSTSEIIETKIEQQKTEAARVPVVEKIIPASPKISETKPVEVESPITPEIKAPIAVKEEPIKVVKEKSVPKNSEAKEDVKLETSEKTNAPSTKQKVASVIIDEELEEIFEVPEAKELSDKLSRLPISDLKKAFGLNEKILTINELFNGDKDSFKQTIKHLNSCSNYSEAKAYLIKHVAAKNEWASSSKKKKAIIFIRLVNRRYS